MNLKNTYDLQIFTKHCKDLENLGVEDGVEAYWKLRAIERQAHKFTLEDCNVGISEEEYDKESEKIYTKIKKIFGEIPDGFFINGDPRGYALKIKESKNGNVGSRIINYQDFGDYGILAPDF